MSSRSIGDLRDLSDEDVRLLYDIVSAAEASRSPPYRALFAAYDKILPQRGISKENDQLYLRFLLRMGEGRKEGQGLFEQFESLLEKLGFQVAFDEDERVSEFHVEDEPDTQDPDLDFSASPPRIRLLQTSSFRPARRASFDSAYDTNTESKPLVTLPVRSRSSDAVSSSKSHLLPAASESSAVLPAPPSSSGGLRPQSPPPRPTSGVKRPHSAAATDREPHESDETLAEDSEEVEEKLDDRSFEPAVELEDDLSIPMNTDMGSMKITAPHQQTSKAYKSNLESHARTLRYHHVAAQAVRVFRNWYDLAQEAKTKHQQMQNDAAERDANVLRRQAFDQWRMASREKRQATETERFFHKLERQASKARDMYLMTKAFTHWAQCASDEVSRRTEARYKMLQTRYFKAWRDITAVNEIKARRLALSKCLSLWVKRTEQVYCNDERAIDFNESASLSQAYRKWFWQFCEHRTPAWYTTRLQQKVFKRWLDLAREARTRESWASEFRSLELTGKTLSQWTNRSHAVQEGNVQAANFRRRVLLGMTADVLQREIQFAPLQSELTRIADFRTVSSAFATWKTKKQMTTHAATVNGLRIMRNAWTKWNDSLRCQALSNVIDDRVVVQALYKWVLAERLRLCEQSTNERLQTQSFKLWLNKSNSMSALLGQAKHSLTVWREQRSTSSALKVWSTRSQARQQEENRAQSFRCQNLMSTTMSLWKSRAQHTARLAKWSGDARFYVLCSKPLKSWHTTTLSTKKNRRREAFTSFRLKVKVSNAKNILQKWRTATASVAGMREQAQKIYQQRLTGIATDLFFNWQQHLIVIQNQSDQAGTIYEQHILMYCMQTWASQFQQLQESEARAIQLDTAHVENAAAASLRQLNWKAFQLKRHQESADSLNKRTQRRHHRDMLRFWVTTAKQRQNDRLIEKQDTQRDDGQSTLMSRGPQLGRTSLTSKRRMPLSASQPKSRVSDITGPAWNPDTSMPLGALPAFPLTPGYLRTPSRRAPSSRLASQTEGPSTITPFMSRIRAQYSTGKQRSSKLLFSVPSHQKDAEDGGFEDVPENESAELDGSESRA